MSKGCEQCKHLEWVDADNDYNSGWSCDKRQSKIFNSTPDWPKVEASFLIKLESEDYRKRFKRCFEGK